MGFGDESQVKVEIVAEMQRFREGTEEATRTLTSFSEQGGKAITQLHQKQQTWTADLAKGQARSSLKLIAIEMGNLAGAGGVAGRAVGSLMAVMGSGGLVAVAALAATAVGALIRSHQQAAVEAQKLEENTLALAGAYDKATEAQASLTEAQREAGEAARATAEEHFAALVEEDRKKVAALENQIRIWNDALAKTKNAQVVVQSSVESLTRAIELEERKLAQARAEMEAHEQGLKDAKTAMDEAATAAKDLSEVIVDPNALIAGREWREGEERIRAYTERLRELQATLDKMGEETAMEVRKKFDEAEQSFMAATSGMRSATETMFTAFITGSKSADQAWRDFTKSFVEQAVAAMANVAVTALFKILGTAILGPGFGAAAGILGLAEGNARVTKPTLAVIGEGDEPENVLTDSQLGAMTAGGIQIASLSFSYAGPGGQNEATRFGGMVVSDFLRLASKAKKRTGRAGAFG